MSGRALPDVPLPGTQGAMVNLAHISGWSVVFCYPYTGRPGVPDPEGWDTIKGAHGSTPQAIAYSAARDDFEARGVRVFGLSFQDPEWQKEFAERHALRVPLLSDTDGTFAHGLGLATFDAGGTTFLKRVTLIAHDGIIIAARETIAHPGRDAAETLALIDGSR
jgi:peroxiredoxin